LRKSIIETKYNDFDEAFRHGEITAAKYKSFSFKTDSSFKYKPEESLKIVFDEVVVQGKLIYTVNEMQKILVENYRKSSINDGEIIKKIKSKQKYIVEKLAPQIMKISKTLDQFEHDGFYRNVLLYIKAQKALLYFIEAMKKQINSNRINPFIDCFKDTCSSLFESNDKLVHSMDLQEQRNFISSFIPLNRIEIHKTILDQSNEILKKIKDNRENINSISSKNEKKINQPETSEAFNIFCMDCSRNVILGEPNEIIKILRLGKSHDLNLAQKIFQFQATTNIISLFIQTKLSSESMKYLQDMVSDLYCNPNNCDVGSVIDLVSFYNTIIFMNKNNVNLVELKEMLVNVGRYLNLNFKHLLNENPTRDFTEIYNYVTENTDMLLEYLSYQKSRSDETMCAIIKNFMN